MANVVFAAEGQKNLPKFLTSAEEIISKIIYPEIIDLATYSPPSDHSVVAALTLVGEIAALGIFPSANGLTAVEAIATNRVYLQGGVHAPMHPRLRAAGMVTLGKICLEKESIAKRAVSKFAAHLSKEEHPVVRNNVIMVLGDLTLVYTGLVDQYLPLLTGCLADPNDLIRMQTAAIVSSLLAEDYIKFKGGIVYRLLYLLSDPTTEIREFVESVFSRVLFLRHSGSLKTLFAETVCALNGYLRHPAYQGAGGNRDFYLTHDSGRRMQIYKFMLTRIVTTEQKFNVTAQLANSLLAAFVDEDATNGAVRIPERETDPAAQVLVDTLYLLSCRELKFSSGGNLAAAVDEDSNELEKKLIDSALQKKTVVESLVPLLVQLNRLCEQKRSPISKNVRDCLRELVKDYKDELSGIMRSDAQLAQELLYDMEGEGVPLEEPTEEVPPATVAEDDVPPATPPVVEGDVAPPGSPDKPIIRSPMVRTENHSESDKSPPVAKRSKKSRKVKSPSPPPERSSRRLSAVKLEDPVEPRRKRKQKPN
jgi:hypothetical protein